mmetsp:Transcript_32859/g.72109  ORF Transcript_32859/g.72109 Transcript_32859/m.72109 type:complete len:629 (-) Transcript_32859:14-1900(-)
MVSTKGEEDLVGASSTTTMLDASNATSAPVTSSSNRKRRLSKKERKNLKKKQRQSNKAGGAATNARTEDDPKTSNVLVEDFTAGYTPIPIPPEINEATSSSVAKKMGKWFPTAVVVKSQTVHNSVTTPHKKRKKSPGGEDENDGNDDDETSKETRKSSLVLFYQYADPPFRQSQVRQLMTYLPEVAKARNLGGRVRVSNEGVNCTLSSLPLSAEGSASAAANLRHLALDLQSFSAVFKETDFKYIDGLPPDRHFKELKIMPVKELVYYGISEKDAPLSEGGVHLDAKDYHKMLARDDAVVIDVRNHYEALIGRFDGQSKGEEEKKKKKKKRNDKNDDVSGNEDEDDKHDETAPCGETKSTGGGGGATYIDPMMRKSTDFPDWLAKPETKEKLAGKRVMMFCTGGIRCERASAYLKKQMGDKVNGVFQLQGGIERYMQEFKDGGYWRGKNFVFDKREAVAANKVAGDGGVVRKPKGGNEPSALQTVDALCCCCSKPWDRYIGKRKCDTCGVPVLMCDACMTTHKGGASEIDVRCDLCKKEGITVPACEVTWTDNGVHGRPSSHADHEGAAGKAASSVLKWGGGHASEKKKLRKLGRKPCRFGSECARRDCMFFHPERKHVGKVTRRTNF